MRLRQLEGIQILSKKEVTYPSDINKLFLFQNDSEYDHEPLKTDDNQRYNWHHNEIAHIIIVEAVTHDDKPAQILLALKRANVSSLPT